MQKTLNAVFVDTSAFLALNNASASLHSKAVRISRKLYAQHNELFTATHILMETATILLQHISLDSALEFLTTVRSGGITILHASQENFAQAEIFFRKQSSKNVSYADCLSLATMKAHNITYAFSFNSNLKKNGFILFK